LRRAEKRQTGEVRPEELAWDGEATARYALEEGALEEVLPVDPPTSEAMPAGMSRSAREQRRRAHRYLLLHP
jgi:hypothetical protein